jgi:hypothetical protein
VLAVAWYRFQGTFRHRWSACISLVLWLWGSWSECRSGSSLGGTWDLFATNIYVVLNVV